MKTRNVENPSTIKKIGPDTLWESCWVSLTMAGMNRKLAAAFHSLPFTILAALGIFIYHTLIAIASVFVWITARTTNVCRSTAIFDQSMPEPSRSSRRMQIQCQLSDGIFPPNIPNSTPNLELLRVDADELELCSKVGSYSALSTPKVYPRSTMIPPEELSKEADNFITNFRRRMRRESKMIKEEKNMEFKQRIERGAL